MNKMSELNTKNIDKRIDPYKAIRNYINCGKIQSCADCECSKYPDFTDKMSMCNFIRNFSAVAREKIEETINEVL